MGYDRSAGMFSPDGLLLQVEYAEKAVNLGTSVIAMATKEGLIYLADRKLISNLLVKAQFKKIVQVDDHLIISGSGVMSDGRRLIEQAQLDSSEHKLKFQSPIDILALVKDIANIQQYYTQTGGMRPFGVSLLIGGIENNKSHLYQTTPSGMYIKFIARAVGKESKKLNEILEKEFKEDFTLKESINFGVNTFKKCFTENFKIERLDIVTLDLKSNIKRYTTQEIKEMAE